MNITICIICLPQLMRTPSVKTGGSMLLLRDLKCETWRPHGGSLLLLRALYIRFSQSIPSLISLYLPLLGPETKSCLILMLMALSSSTGRARHYHCLAQGTHCPLRPTHATNVCRYWIKRSPHTIFFIFFLSQITGNNPPKNRWIEIDEKKHIIEITDERAD